MRLFIAEKPDLAKAIVAGLGGGTRQEGYYACGTDYVTWCFGHMLQLLDPEDYDAKYKQWQLADLPIVHIPWRKKPGSDKAAQLTIITNLLKEAASVVNAGDPDEEGQLIVDEILQYANCTLPVKRLLINDNNTKVVQKALQNLRDNAEFAGLSAMAEARSVGDQLYGYNLTRAYTLCARKLGYNGILSVGRVQTPILGLVVRRTRAYHAHQVAHYYTVSGQFSVQGLDFPAKYQVKDGDPVDDNGRLIEESFAKQLAATVGQQVAQIMTAETKDKTQPPPLPYNLLKLQTDAARKFNLKPEVVKDITQNLREKYKLITYNRSDCEYLSEEQHSDAPEILAAISATAPALAPLAKQGDPTRKSRAFNSSKVSAHHAIVPTGASVTWSQLTLDEQRIYTLIARAYIAQFWPNHTYQQTDLVLAVAGHNFTVRANFTTQLGWQALYQGDLEGQAESVALDLRALKAQCQGTCREAAATKMATKPQPLYTMASLLTDLTRVAKYIKDERLRQLLQAKDKDKAGEHGGIGTPATRDSIIATLFNREYLCEKNKSIIPTKAGEEFYDALPEQAKYPDMTALWHEQQQAILRGEETMQNFIDELMLYISTEIKRVSAHGLSLVVKTTPCPNCQQALRRVKGSQGYFWGCTGFPDCKFIGPDKAGVLAVSAHKCASCGKALVRRAGKIKGTHWWGCSGFPTCKQTYLDQKNKPIYGGKVT